MNSVTLTGRLTANPAVHAGGKHQTCTFRIAVGRPNSDGADFVDIVAFDRLGAVCADWLTKGREIAVVGKLRLSEWTDRNGQRRSRVQVVADTVQFLGKPTRTGSPDDGGVADPDNTPADRPALGKYRKAS